MFINKIGQDHIFYGLQNQDYGFECDNIKCVVDGCSEGKHSEVGAKLFCYKYLNTKDLPECIIEQLSHEIFCNNSQNIFDYMLFTVLFCKEYFDKWIVRTCGDGYIILQDYLDRLILKELKEGAIEGYPLYYSYKFILEEKLNGLKHNQIVFKEHTFLKSEYKNVGVATDGIRYIFGQNWCQDFKKLIIIKSEVKIKRFINKYQNDFKDDITIVF
jgi:hypothetical protein